MHVIKFSVEYTAPLGSHGLMERKLVHVISDYQQGGLGAGNLHSAIYSTLPSGWDVVLSSVFNYDTISTGYLMAQYGLRQEELRPSDLILFAYCSPRSERRRNSEGDEQEEYLYAKLRNDVRILAVNSGHTLSFVRGNITELRSLDLGKRDDHLRLHDYLPKVVGDLASNNYEFLGDEVDVQSAVPDFPHGVICYIDNFGNIRTTYRDHDDVIRHVKALGSGARIRVEINGEVRATALASGDSEVLEGDMVFGPEHGGYLNRYWEISCRRGDAAALFNNPPPGSSIKLIIHQR